MKRKYFGTDGVRGPVGGPLINPEFAARLGAAAGTWLREHGGAALGSRVVIGRDTRASGPMLAAAVATGLQKAGLHVMDAGVVPTPAIAMAVRDFGCAGGVAITASHNPASDNGIKFFDARGLKLSDSDELRIEANLDAIGHLPVSGGPVETVRVADAFVVRARSILPEGSLSGWKVALDAGNGAAFETSPAALRALGADVSLIGASPDGTNINAGVGSQHPEKLLDLVRSSGARIGIAHDGDADRVVLVDERGDVCDGDELLAILALHALRTGRLPSRTLVATIQSNLGLDAALRAEGGEVLRTPVGDRYVAEAMLAGGHVIGGENSGHVICAQVSMSGDGLAAALLAIRVMLETGKPLSKLRGWLKLFPQGNRNLKVREKPDFASLPGFSAELAAIEGELAGRGRVLARYSGTEPKLRLLVESDSAELNARLLDRLQAAFEREV
jgi:phosphoglucosamine mutase